MMKRILATVLCACLLLPFIGTAAGQVASAEGAGDYLLRNLSFRYSNNLTLSGAGLLIERGADIPTLNVRDNYEDDLDRIAVQFDTYLDGDDSFVKYMMSGALLGQFEITSSGCSDKEEIGITSGDIFKFTKGEWKRTVVPLSRFTQKTGGNLNTANINYFRIFMQEFSPEDLHGGSGVLKICNVYIVDTAQEPVSEKELPLGDGSFVPDPPQYRKMNVGAAYNDGEDVYAGYNLKEYLAAHPEISVYNTEGQKDYAPAVNSLLEGLAAAGGGALFIPAGEWEFRNELVLPDGTSLIGEWTNPDESAAARGTVLKVYSGKGLPESAAFITMGAHTLVQYMSFWYPEQTVEGVAYPPTIDLYQYANVRNLTLYNSYYGIRSSVTANCPNVWNIYGTPLNIGLDIDRILDVARIEEVHFAADYWINSGLAGAPETAEEIAQLEQLLYTYAIGITIRRMDWSYVSYCDIKGYNIGLLFAQSIDGSYPNGQCVGLNFSNCMFGHFVYGVQTTSEAMLDITMRNCKYGIYMTGETMGTLQYYNADIQATDYAVYMDNSHIQFNMLASTVRGGRVYTKKGNSIFINNKFLTSSPQVELDYGTVTSVLLGNTDAYGEEIDYVNEGNCPLDYEAKKMDLEPYKAVSRDEVKAPYVGPTSSEWLAPTDIDNSGATDVTEAIQSKLTALGQNGGGTLFLRPGEYRIDGTLTIPKGVQLRGAGDHSSIPKAVNTILQVRTPIEEGENQYTSTATVTLSEGSGVRGIIFNYPDQYQTYRKVDKVLDPVRTEELGKDFYVDYYEFDFIPYPFAVRGTGADVYLKYVTIRNGWNGVDLATYRCDNHVIDNLMGHVFHHGVVIGNGTTGGIVRNQHFNYNSIRLNNEFWSGWSGVPSNANERSWFHQPMMAQIANNTTVFRLGHVEDQLLYNCVTYGAGIGVHLIGEPSGAADVRICGFSIDYGRVPVMVEEAENAVFTNAQLTAFNQAGDNLNTGRWAVDQETDPIYAVWLRDTFEGEITFYNYLEWDMDLALPPNASVRVDNGTLNMYSPLLAHRDDTPLFEMHGDGKANVVGITVPLVNHTEHIPALVTGEGADNLTVTAGLICDDLSVWEDFSNVKYVYEYNTRFSVPKNVTFTEDSEIVFTESFDSFEMSDFGDTSMFRVSVPSTVSIRRGAVRMRMDATHIIQGLTCGAVGDELPFELVAGKTNSLYRMEWRFVVDEMRGSEDSEVYIYLTNAAGQNQEVVTVRKDGTVLQQDGQTVGKIQMGTYYRLAIEVDARDADNKTATVYLMDDNSRLLGKGATGALDSILQGDNTVCGFWFSAYAMPVEALGTQTDMTLDYFYVTCSERTTFGRDADIGDVNGDGNVDSTDARLILQYAVGKIADNALLTKTADVDGNGKIDSTDARLTLQYTVGKIKTFPAA